MQDIQDVEFDRPDGEAFSIQNDAQAGWAMRKIKAIRADRDRFIGQCQERKQSYCREMDAMIETKRKGAGRDECYFIDVLKQYADQQDEEAFSVSKKTGVRNYRLPEGKLVYKPATSALTHNPDVLLASLKAHGLTEYIRTKEEPAWADVKPNVIMGDSNVVLVKPDGEAVPIEGVGREDKPGRFEVEVK